MNERYNETLECGEVVGKMATPSNDGRLYIKLYSITNSVIVMYDSVNFRIRKVEAGGINFMEQTACYLEDVSTHSFKNGETVLSGCIGDLKVTASNNQLKVKDGSLCKWYLGDNYQTMGRSDTKKAIEKLSDTLHLPMNKATVSRLDIAQNFITKHPPEVYFNHLGELKNYKRSPMIAIGDSGLYYSSKCSTLCFYDKNREQKSKGGIIPELYLNQNVLRYEQRYTSRIHSKLGVPEITGELLYNEVFYKNILNRWLDTYNAIMKINDVSLNFREMTTKRDFLKRAVLTMIEKEGGQLQMLEQIKEVQKQGILTPKQAYDIRQTINDACKVKEGLTAPNEAITELDKKIKEAIKFYH